MPVYVCGHVCVYMCMHVCVWVWVWTCVGIYVHACVCVGMGVGTGVWGGMCGVCVGRYVCIGVGVWGGMCVLCVCVGRYVNVTARAYIIMCRDGETGPADPAVAGPIISSLFRQLTIIADNYSAAYNLVTSLQTINFPNKAHQH